MEMYILVVALTLLICVAGMAPCIVSLKLAKNRMERLGILEDTTSRLIETAGLVCGAVDIIVTALIAKHILFILG